MYTAVCNVCRFEKCAQLVSPTYHCYSLVLDVCITCMKPCTVLPPLLFCTPRHLMPYPRFHGTVWALFGLCPSSLLDQYSTNYAFCKHRSMQSFQGFARQRTKERERERERRGRGGGRFAYTLGTNAVWWPSLVSTFYAGSNLSTFRSDSTQKAGQNSVCHLLCWFQVNIFPRECRVGLLTVY